MRSRFAIPVTVTCCSAGLLLGALEGAAVSWPALVLTAFVALLIGPLGGAALVAALPEVGAAEKWRPGDLLLPALASSAAFSFVVSHVLYSGLSSAF
jgi:uncharacterized membrane protein YdjX (TVP38/TMEM64 family)